MSLMPGSGAGPSLAVQWCLRRLVLVWLVLVITPSSHTTQGPTSERNERHGAASVPAAPVDNSTTARFTSLCLTSNVVGDGSPPRRPDCWFFLRCEFQRLVLRQDTGTLPELHTAAQGADLNEVRRLLRSGSDPNARACDGSSALHWAASAGHAEIAKELSDHGADKGAVAFNGHTPLHTAMHQTSSDATRQLVLVLISGTDPTPVNARDNQGQTPLLLAAARDRPKTVALLMEKGPANASIASVSGRTPAHHAAVLGFAQVIRELGSSRGGRTPADLDQRDAHGLSPLHVAAGSAHAEDVQPDSVRALLANGASPNSTTPDGRSALHWAALRGSAEVALVLIEWACDVDIADNDMHQTALHVTAHRGDATVARMLLDAHARTDVEDSLGRTPLQVAKEREGGGGEVALLLQQRMLHRAAARGDVETIKQTMLEWQPGDSRGANSDGNAALHIAAKHDQAAVIVAILDGGASFSGGIDEPGEDGGTALHWAARTGSLEALGALIGRGADIDAMTDTYGMGHVTGTPLHWACEACQVEAVRTLLEHSARHLLARAKSGCQRTPLHEALRKCPSQAVDIATAILARASADHELISTVETRDGEGNTPLVTAVRAGNLNATRLLVSNYAARVDARSRHPTSTRRASLHVAVIRGDVDIVRVLLDKGAKVDIKDRDTRTPLHHVGRGPREIVELLLGANANVSARDSLGDTPLHSAARTGASALVEQLVRTGRAEVDAANLKEQTPLCLASSKEVALVLIPAGATTDHMPGSLARWTPLHCAAFAQNDGVANVLLEHGANTFAQAANNDMPLHIAARSGHTSTVRVLLSALRWQVSTLRLIEVVGAQGKRPLHMAAEEGHSDVVRVLMNSYGADAFATCTLQGYTPLHYATLGGHTKTVRMLLHGHGAGLTPGPDIRAANGRRDTALHIAARKGFTQMVKGFAMPGEPAALAAPPPSIRYEGWTGANVDVDVKNNNGSTPLREAALHGHADAAQLLLTAGANVHKADNFGWGPLDYATAVSQSEVQELLVQAGARPSRKSSTHAGGWNPVLDAVVNNRTDALRELLDAGADVNTKDTGDTTLLHHAAGNGIPALVELLLDSGADIEARDWYATPLSSAIAYGRIDTVKLLLKKGADTSAADTYGTTPLHLAVSAVVPCIAVVEALLQHEPKADPDAQNNNGHTPLHIAAQTKQVDVARLLLAAGANPWLQEYGGARNMAIHDAACVGSVDFVKLLVTKDKSMLEARDRWRGIPLHTAAWCGRTDTVRALIDAGADASVNEVNHEGWTPLYHAVANPDVEHSHSAVVQVLLDKGATLEHRSETDLSPLHMAVRAGSVAGAQALLAAGADWTAVDKRGFTPEKLAEEEAAGAQWDDSLRIRAAAAQVKKHRELGALFGLTPMGNAAPSVRQCPNDCSGHGDCVASTFTAADGIRTWRSASSGECNCHSSWTVGFGAGETQVKEWYGDECSLRHCPSGDDPTTVEDETDCAGKGNNGAMAGPGERGNLCHVDCANRGTCDAATGICDCFPPYFGYACTMLSRIQELL